MGEYKPYHVFNIPQNISTYGIHFIFPYPSYGQTKVLDEGLKGEIKMSFKNTLFEVHHGKERKT